MFLSYWVGIRLKIDCQKFSSSMSSFKPVQHYGLRGDRGTRTVFMGFYLYIKSISTFIVSQKEVYTVVCWNRLKLWLWLDNFLILNKLNNFFNQQGTLGFHFLTQRPWSSLHHLNKHCEVLVSCSVEKIKNLKDSIRFRNLPWTFPLPSLILPWTFSEPSLNLHKTFPEPS